MINIYELTYNTLLTLNHPVREHGSYDPNDKLPATFITYQLINDINNSHADNQPTSITYRVQITLYTTDPVMKQQAMYALNSVMLPASYLRVGGRDLPFNASTGHYAYTCDYRYYDSIH